MEMMENTGAWSPVPWWHPARWIGYGMRRRGMIDRAWQYETYRQHARRVLEIAHG